MTGPKKKQLSQADLDYCRDLIANSCEERLISLGYAPKDKQPALIAVYAFHAELQKIPFAVSEPNLGEIRLQWWRDALAEVFGRGAVRAHPVVQLMAATTSDRPDLKPAMDKAINATRFLFSPAGFTSLAQALRFFEETEGYAAVLAAGILDVAEVPRTIVEAGALDIMATMLVTEAPPSKGALIRSAAEKFGELATAEGSGIVGQLRTNANDILTDLSGQPSKLMPAMAHFVMINPKFDRAKALINGAEPRPESPFRALELRWRIFRTVLSGKF